MSLPKIAVVAALIALTGCSREPVDAAALAAEKGCVTCHGTDGVGIAPSFPTLAGQWPTYLRVQLLAYRSGKRQNAVMNVQAAALTEEEIAILADYYGEKP